MKLYKIYTQVLKESEDKVELVSKTQKGNRYFEMLKTAKFQHYDMPKGELVEFSRGEEDRKRMVSKLNKADKKTYRAWLKTPEGEASKKLFQSYASNSFKGLSESTIVDKYGDELMVDENWMNLNIPVRQYKTNVKDALVEIIRHEKGISEKNFSEYDKVIESVAQFFKENEDANDIINENEPTKSRVEFVAEMIYSKYFN